MARIAIAGVAGRMGRMLVEAVLASDDLRLAGATPKVADTTGSGPDARRRQVIASTGRVPGTSSYTDL